MKYLNDLFIIPNIKTGTVQISFSAPDNANSISWKILDASSQTISSGSIVKQDLNTAIITASIPNCKLWSISCPYLYTLQIECNGITQKTAFGMRTFGKSERNLFLNDEKLYVRGYIRGHKAHEHPNLMGLSLTEYYEKNIKAAKRFGFNLIRFHSSIPPEECFEVADRLGMLIHIEIRKFNYQNQTERTDVSEVGKLVNEDDWREVIKALRNHPSLMVYCMGNEIRNPGSNPFAEHIANITKELDPTRLFIDTCAHGEFDRTYVDFDVQHMSYFYPYSDNYDMFDNTYNWLIYGSCTGKDLVDCDDDDSPSYTITRAIDSKRPVIAHEVCHYAAYHDLDALSDKFDKYAPDDRPWWINELKKLAKLKGYNSFYSSAMEASKRFQFISWKLALEAARRSSLLCGFHFLQLADTERYENSNGLLDCFDDSHGIDEDEFSKFNSDTVLLADLPRRTYYENETINIPILISNYAEDMPQAADFTFDLTDILTGEVIRSGKLKEIELKEKGLREICTVDLLMPEITKSTEYKFTVKLINSEKEIVVNDWPVWIFTNKPEEMLAQKVTINLAEINTNLRYPQLEHCDNEDLLITNSFDDAVFEQLENGKDVLMLYRIDETRDRKWSCKKEKYYLPTNWDRFKGVIWDRGHNCGAIIKQHDAFLEFPNNGYLNLQFHDLIDDCDKINLDDFPVKIDPIMRGIDRASRDRFDVTTYALPEFQPEWTMRNFAYAFEINVGKGRLFISAFNFSGLNSNNPATCAMFESLIKYVNSDKFRPQSEISVDSFKSYLETNGASPRTRERKMTQYWQLNSAPLESARYWKESELYISGELDLPAKKLYRFEKNMNPEK